MLLEADHHWFFVVEIEWLQTDDAVFISLYVVDGLFDLVAREL